MALQRTKLGTVTDDLEVLWADFGGSPGKGGDVGLLSFLLRVLEGGNARGLQGLIGAHRLGSPE